MAEGTSRVFLPGRNCYACSLSPEEMAGLRRRLSCSNVIRMLDSVGAAPTSSITASVIGAVQAQEAMRIACGDTSSCGKMFYYDGDVPTSGAAGFTAYDDDCPEHEAWDPVEPSSFTVDSTVSDVLSSFPDCGKDVSILLREDIFVDYIVNRRTGERHSMMMPGRKVVESLPENSFSEDFYQNEYRTIGIDFPYKDLTLRALGIPDGDILHLCCAGKDRFVELEWK